MGMGIEWFVQLCISKKKKKTKKKKKPKGDDPSLPLPWCRSVSSSSGRTWRTFVPPLTLPSPPPPLLTTDSFMPFLPIERRRRGRSRAQDFRRRFLAKSLLILLSRRRHGRNRTRKGAPIQLEERNIRKNERKERGTWIGGYLVLLLFLLLLLLSCVGV